jgi:hypothetical protein
VRIDEKLTAAFAEVEAAVRQCELYYGRKRAIAGKIAK